MTERPILFSAPMVRALLAGTKTQTRRIVKPQPVENEGMNCRRLTFYRKSGEPAGNVAIGTDAISWFCPYGVPGDVLWVRETWRPIHSGDPSLGAQYLADKPAGWRDQTVWRPSIHMFRWASRISLRITDVRVERLNEISEADAAAEGLLSFPVDDEEEPNWHWEPQNDPHQGFGSAGDAYSELWEAINGRGSWAANPWVWAVSFERLTGDAP